ncbi:unnamed protein product [Knipowitschia caucasica]|uniref:DNA oxidative demethylase ALKBH2 n=1 Tax=Knipowitschia caucasica TaxID=637954 RepID=A0AAV2MRR4_KNICA
MKKRITSININKTKKPKVEKDVEEFTAGDDCDEETALAEFANPVPWQKIEAEGFDCDYALLFPKEEADILFRKLEEEVEYATGKEAQVQVFGKVYNIPRKQATYGDAGLAYTYSGVKRFACPWTPTLEHIREATTKSTGQTFNFVLVNRYKDGLDHMGEHRDDEKELDPLCPIASLSFGAVRDFIFRHKDSRGKNSQQYIEPVKLELAHGSLLLMNPPTNTYWYHSLPIRKKVTTPRINLTFRRIVMRGKKCIT